MPAQGRGANLDTSRRVGASGGVRQQAAQRVAARPEAGDRGPERSREQNNAFGPKPSPETGINERNRALRTPSFHPATRSEGKVWVGKEVVRPAMKYGGVEAPRPAPFSPSRRTGPFERGNRAS